MRALVATVTAGVLLSVLPPAGAAHPGGNGRLVWKTSTETGPEVGRRLWEEGVDVALITPT